MGKVFISYEKHDAATATALCSFLEGDGVACWIAPRDIDAGEDYAGQIVRAVKDSKALVVICSDFTKQSGHVLNEVSIAFDQKIQIIPYSLGFVQLGDSLDYYLAAIHRIVSNDDQQEDFKRIKEAVESSGSFLDSVEKSAPSRRAGMILTGVSAILLIAASGLLIFRQKPVTPVAGGGLPGLEVGLVDSVRQDSLVVQMLERDKEVVAELKEEQSVLPKEQIAEKIEKQSEKNSEEASVREPVADTVPVTEPVLEPAHEPVSDPVPVPETKSLKDILIHSGSLSGLEGLADYYHVTINTSSRTLDSSYLLICSQDGTIRTVLSPLDASGLRANLKTGEKINKIAYSKEDLVVYVKS